MKPYQLSSIKSIKVVRKLFRKIEQDKINKHLKLYSSDIGRAVLFLDPQSDSVIQMGFDIRSRTARAYITRALKHLDGIGFHNPESKGHVLFLKTSLALKELETTPSEHSLMNCHTQLTRRVTVDGNGRLMYMKYIKI